MFAYSTILRSLLWLVMGPTYVLVIAGAGIWARDLGLQMTWWKWLLATGWYAGLSIGLGAGMTLIGEKGPRAAYYLLGLPLLIAIIAGMVLWSIL